MNTPARLLLCLFELLVVPLAVGQAAPSDKGLVLDFDSIFEWDKPCTFTAALLEAKLASLEAVPGEKVYALDVQQNRSQPSQLFDITYPEAHFYKMRYRAFGNSDFMPLSVRVTWKDQVIENIIFHFEAQDGQTEADPRLLESIGKTIGSERSPGTSTGYAWMRGRHYIAGAFFIKNSGAPRFLVSIRPRHDPNAPPASPAPSSPSYPPDYSAGNVAPDAKVDLDSILNWNDPFIFSHSDLGIWLKPQMDAIGARFWHDRAGSTILGINGSLSIPVTLFGGRFNLPKAELVWAENAAQKKYLHSILMEIDEKQLAANASEEWLHARLDALLGVKGRFAPGAGSDNFLSSTTWSIPACVVRALRTKTDLKLQIHRAEGFDPNGLTEPLFANLDALLNFTTLWGSSSDDFEKVYTAKAVKEEDQKRNPQFEWMNAERSRARFSRQMFPNVDTRLSMFAGSIKVEEAILEFVNGRAVRSTISFYNRGDSGDIAISEFDRIFKLVGQNLGQVLKVAPKRQINSGNAALPVTGWMWTSPNAIALLEHTEYSATGKITKPEFLRLRLAAPGQSDFTMGKMVTGVQSMELIKRVMRKPDGDVYIGGMPMVDQGNKGYCVAASCQRLFEYMRIPCDQHEMARLVSVDAQSGANIIEMQKALSRIDERFKVSFKALINPENFYSGNTGRRRVSDKQFAAIVKEYVDKGGPLLWGLVLGKATEDPPLPRGGQVLGGHMRMIIGYNTARSQILFTDSWGAGHELKRMSFYDAYEVTLGIYSMAPRGL